MSQATVPATPTNLTDGLLDLLNKDQSAKPDPPTKEISPIDVGAGGEDLGAQREHPLESIRQSMMIAAKSLERGSLDVQAKQLRSDIVLRLDELIEQFEQSQNSESNPESNPSQQEQQQSQQAQRQSTVERSTSEPEKSASSESTDGTRGQSSPSTNVEIDLSDPSALQQNVWGHLPERLRMQMQSRMVEQFLPSYRVQIEEYFKALLEQR